MQETPENEIDDSEKKSGVSRSSALGATSLGAQNTPNLGIRSRQAAFLAAVAGDCGCPRCCGYRDLANIAMNPGSEY